MAGAGEVQQVNRKIALLGDRGVGKTSLAAFFVEGRFSERYDPTIEVTYQKKINFKRMTFLTDIVDTAGMDEYSRPSRNATVGVDGYVLVYSTTNRGSFDKIRTINEVLMNMLGDPPELPRILVGTMTDLADARVVSQEAGRALAAELGIPFLECSSKEGHNVSEVFVNLLGVIEKDNPTVGSGDDSGNCIIL